MPRTGMFPGLKRMRRKTGRVDLYWVADEASVKAGYPVKTVRLFGDLNDPQDAESIANRCRILTAEMREWMSGTEAARNTAPPRTIAWLCDAFQIDADSPYHERRQATRAFYDQNIKIIRATVGDRDFDDITGRDVRRWYRNWRQPDGDGGKVHERRAYACIQTLRRLFSYGCELREPGCFEVSKMLSEMQFSMPKSRKRRPTYEQIAKVRDIALHDSRILRPSLALAVTMQFDLSMRQKDVIGEWIRDGSGQRKGIMDGEWRWDWGLTWDQIDSDWILRKPTSKSNGSEIAEHDLKLYPDTIELLKAIPRERRIGPIIIDESSGKPYRREQFGRKFREAADLAGWPKGLWNMDSRAGAVSEAFEAGAMAEDVMKAATHRQMSTTMIYNRGSIEQTARVAQLRIARRNAARTGGGNTPGNTSE